MVEARDPGRAELKELFFKALEIPADQREAFLEGLRAESGVVEALRALLRAHDQAGSFLESPVAFPPTAPSLEPGARLGPYEIVDLIGHGGMGVVYRARDTRLGRHVAIKVLPPEFVRDPGRRQRFEDEARAASALNHPNVLTVYDVGTVDGAGSAAFLVMELLEGETLRGRVNRPPALRREEVIAIATQIARGLAAAHAEGIVHRDIKPENLFLTGDGRIKILDFGIAKLTASPDLPRAATDTGVVIGTAGYIAPEQARGQAIDARADIFSFGAVIFEMITGTRAFARDSAVDTLSAILHSDPLQEVRGVRSRDPVFDVIERCLEKDPVDRYQTALDVAAALGTAMVTQTPSVGRSSSWSRRRLATVAGAITLAATIIAGAVAFRTADQPSASSAKARPSLVLLPTRVFGAPGAEFLADAVPASLSTYLAQIKELDTSVPPTADEVARVNGDIKRIADAYGATTGVLTSITAQGEALVLAIQLVEPETRRVVWSRQYEGDRDSYLEMLRRAARGVQSELLPSATSPLSATANRSSSGELAFQTGEHHFRRYSTAYSPASFEAAREAYSRALVAEPMNAAALARLSFLYQIAWQAGQLDQSTSAREARTWAQKAVEVDPRSGLSWAALVGAAIFEAEPQIDVVLSHALRAALYGERCSECQGALSEALAGSAFTLSLAALDMAHRLDPLTLVYGGNYAFSLMMLGRSPEALSAIAETRALEPEEPWTLLQETIILASMGRLAQAQQHLKALERATRERRLHPSAYRSVNAVMAIATGSTEQAAEELKTARANVTDPTRSYWDRLQQQMVIVPFLVQSGDRGSALDLLESGAAQNVVVPFDWLMLDPRLAPVRSDVRFVRLARSAKARSDLAATVLRQADMRAELPPHLREPLRQLDTLNSQFVALTQQDKPVKFR